MGDFSKVAREIFLFFVIAMESSFFLGPIMECLLMVAREILLLGPILTVCYRRFLMVAREIDLHVARTHHCNALWDRPLVKPPCCLFK